MRVHRVSQSMRSTFPIQNQLTKPLIRVEEEKKQKRRRQKSKHASLVQSDGSLSREEMPSDTSMQQHRPSNFRELRRGAISDEKKLLSGSVGPVCRISMHRHRQHELEEPRDKAEECLELL